MSDIDFNEWKEKVAGFAVNAAEKAKDIANVTADQARRVTRIAKLRYEIAAEKESMKKSFAEIGKLYYETHKDAPEGFFVQLCEEAKNSEALIAEKEAELCELKASVGEEDDPACDPDFESVVAETEAAAEPTAEEEPKAE